MECETLRLFFNRFSKDKLLKICRDNKLGEDLKKSSCTKNCLSRLLVEHAIVRCGKYLIQFNRLKSAFCGYFC